MVLRAALEDVFIDIIMVIATFEDIMRAASSAHLLCHDEILVYYDYYCRARQRSCARYVDIITSSISTRGIAGR